MSGSPNEGDLQTEDVQKGSSMTLIIVGIAVGLLLILAVVVDVSCHFANQTGKVNFKRDLKLVHPSHLSFLNSWQLSFYVFIERFSLLFRALFARHLAVDFKNFRNAI